MNAAAIDDELIIIEQEQVRVGEIALKQYQHVRDGIRTFHTRIRRKLVNIPLTTPIIAQEHRDVAMELHPLPQEPVNWKEAGFSHIPVLPLVDPEALNWGDDEARVEKKPEKRIRTSLDPRESGQSQVCPVCGTKLGHGNDCAVSAWVASEMPTIKGGVTRRVVGGKRETPRQMQIRAFVDTHPNFVYPY